MENQFQAQTQTPARNFLRYVEDGDNGGLPAPASEYVTRNDLATLRKQILADVLNAVQQVVQQRQAAPTISHEEDPRRRQMHEMAD